jgi:IS5 family transposase
MCRYTNKFPKACEYRKRHSRATIFKNISLSWRYRKAKRGAPLSESQRSENRERSRVRVRVEHVFGAMFQKARDLMVRTIGLRRAAAKIGLRNIAYNPNSLFFIVYDITNR